MDNRSKFAMFTVVWSMSTLFHQFTFTDWVGHAGVGWLVTAACILNIFLQREAIFLAALLGNIVLVFLRMPAVPNHIFFEWLTNCTLLAFILVRLIRERTFILKDQGAVLWEGFAPVARISLVILYFYVVFHKLNTSFFDPSISCGALFIEDVFHNFYLHKIGFIHKFLLSNGLLLRHFSIYFTLVAEALIPIFLLWSRLRFAGLLFGVFFHFLLPFQGHEGIYSFSALIYTFYVFFWSDLIFISVQTFCRKYRRGIAAFFALGLLAALVFKFQAPVVLFKIITTLFFLVYAYVYFVLLWKSRAGNKPASSIRGKGLKYAFLWLGPAVIAFNGLTPYLGLKTEFSFSMFSNLRTEGGSTNHILVPVSTQVFGFQKELVTILDTDKERLRYNDRYYNNDVQLVPFEFVRLLNAQKDDFYIKFRLGAREYTVRKEKGVFVENGGLELDQAPILRKFFRFRPVYPSKSLCQH